MITLTNQQARQFILLKHGLLGRHKFSGKQGALDFVRQAGCIQYDPVDSCGKNSELVLQSRIKGFSKKTLYELLYRDRKLVDYPDKNLSIIPAADWPYFERYRDAARAGGLRFAELAEFEAQTAVYVNANGPLCSGELPISGDLRWHSSIHWSGNWDGKTNAARAVLEQMYSTGKLVIHHKKGARKYYDLAAKHLPSELLDAHDPLPDDLEHRKWRVLRRIGAVGLLWNRPSDAWLNIWGLKSTHRNEIFSQLLAENKIIEITVDGVKDAFFCRGEDMSLIEHVQSGLPHKHRCELIAPLDNLLWDRKLIKVLFGFDYTWEIYVPADKRKYGFYVLPLLYGDSFVGRVEAIAERRSKTLVIKNIWYEDGVKQTKKQSSAICGCLKRFAKFNECEEVSFKDCVPLKGEKENV